MKRYVLVVVSLLAAWGAAALEVDVEELKKTVDREIIFINYEGPQERIEAADEIKAIGWLLAQSLAEEGERAGFLLKYSIIRALDPAVKGKFDADIFSIDREARVDHIDNIRRILAGFLEGAYGFSAEDARLLSVFVTVYNAVFRGNLPYFTEMYKPVVLGHIDADNAGLSILYSDWPGATRMLIPLSEGAQEGDLSALSTSELTEEAVIEEMRRQPDMGLEDRKDMVELKEREVEEKQAAEERLAEEIEEERAALEAAADRERQAPDAAAEAELEARKQALADKEAESRELAAEIAGKQAEIEAERSRIVADERSRDEARAAAADRPAVYSDQLYYLRVTDRDDRGHLSGSLGIIDPLADRFAVTSPVGPISGRSFLFFRDQILVAAHERNSRGPVRLALLDPLSLEATLYSSEEISPDSALAAAAGRIYAVVRRQGTLYLGCFDADLRLVARSEEEVEADSSLTVSGDSVYVNAAGGGVLRLSVRDLSRSALLD
jgi:multidrug efflux pump subunit AcrA (membrane-fusion protein)